MTEYDRVGPTLLLDLDGTLVDSVPDLLASLNRLMAARGLAPFTAPEVRAMVGDGAPALVRKAMAARSCAAERVDIGAFIADYTAHAADESRPFEGVPETLAALRESGWRLAVCTNKPERPARHMLAAFGLLDLFAAVGGGDSFPCRKPDPAHLLATLAAAGGEPGAAVMVGDYRNDVVAAAAAGIPCVFAAWGYGPRGMAEGADAIAERVTDLPRVLSSLAAGSRSGTWSRRRTSACGN